MKTRTEIATGRVQTFTWDYRNRLVGVDDSTGASVAYTYDGMDQRIAKTVNGSTTSFVYDPDNVAMEFSGNSSTPSTRYLQGTGVDQTLAQESNNGTSWLLTDHLGTTRDLVNNSGSVVNHYTYDSFGNVVAATPGATADTRYKYTGREWDAETGLYYYRARYYDPATGRFIEQDPIGFEAGDANLYRYVGNDSTNLVDPSGLFKIELEYDKIANLGHHARLIFVRENGIRVMYEAGPSEGGSGNASRNTSGSKGSSGFLVPNMDTFGKPDLSPHPLNLTQFIYDSNRDNNCKSELQTEQAIRKMFLALIPARVDYQTLSRNSNSAVFQALENTLPGNQRPVPKSGLWVPAWEINPFTGKRSPKAPPPPSLDLDPHKNLPPNLPSGTWAM